MDLALSLEDNITYKKGSFKSWKVFVDQTLLFVGYIKTKLSMHEFRSKMNQKATKLEKLRTVAVV